MKIVVSAVLFVILLAYSVCGFAQTARTMEVLTPGNTVTALTVAKYAPTTGPQAGQKAIKALVIITGNTAAWTCDGTTPTQTGGTDVAMQTPANGAFELNGYHDISAFRVVDATASSACKVRVTYFFEQ